MLHTRNNNGFTLIELLIALALASILFLVVGGTFVRTFNFYNRVQANREVVNNVNQTFEVMRRYIQSATRYAPGFDADCVGTSTDMSFAVTSNQRQLSFLYQGRCHRFMYNAGQIHFTGISPETGESFRNTLIKDREVDVRQVIFEVQDEQGKPSIVGDKVRILMKATSKDQRATKLFTVQTTISVRYYGVVPTLPPTDIPVAPTGS